MIAGMAKAARQKSSETTTAFHGVGSYRLIASQLRDLAQKLDIAADLMEQQPLIERIEVRYERTRKDGLKWMESWVSQAVESVREAKLVLFSGVSGKSDTHPNGKKTAPETARK